MAKVILGNKQTIKVKNDDPIEGETEQLGEKIGIFGGTFDPVHNGHCALVDQFKQQCNLDSVIVIPAANPPHKLTLPLSDFEHRFTMLSLAFSDVPGVFLSRIEQYREGPSYTIDTLHKLKKSIGPNRDWFFAVGEDSLAEIHTWKQYQDIPDQACVVVFNRRASSLYSIEDVVRNVFPGYRPGPDKDRFFDKDIVKIRIVDMPFVNISSSQIKQAIADHEDWLAMVPKKVSPYIIDHFLYK